MTRTHHAAGPGAPDGGGGSDAQLEQRLSAVLRDRAALAPEAPSVRAAADALGVVRRRRRQRAGAGAVLGSRGCSPSQPPAWTTF
ncbi:hypothetical protein [Quadrisphaera sp. INWT6]|uniref:hypothetical protein n=1 Tax=Quadrisphaera sp. INWT6 TaxID=2596917 RepID=UPI001892824F|nr:hypothetical protein [Quadrisphaera sp. INWT6]MBF5082164.1 hypothetical protein [Quadrisphaera sp. INWT6]